MCILHCFLLYFVDLGLLRWAAKEGLKVVSFGARFLRGFGRKFGMRNGYRNGARGHQKLERKMEPQFTKVWINFEPRNGIRKLQENQKGALRLAKIASQR